MLSPFWRMDSAGGYLYDFVRFCNTEHSEEWDGTYRQHRSFWYPGLPGAGLRATQSCYFDKNGNYGRASQDLHKNDRTSRKWPTGSYACVSTDKSV